MPISSAADKESLEMHMYCNGRESKNKCNLRSH